MSWIVLAIISALLAGLTGTLTKAGLEKVDSNLAMAIESVLILVITWSVVGFQGKIGDIAHIERRSWWFLLGAGVVTTLAYLVYFAALAKGESNRVQPIDRLSLVFAIVLALFFLKEKVSAQVWIGAGLMAGGAVLIAMAKPAK